MILSLLFSSSQAALQAAPQAPKVRNLTLYAGAEFAESFAVADVSRQYVFRLRDSLSGDVLQLALPMQASGLTAVSVSANSLQTGTLEPLNGAAIWRYNVLSYTTNADVRIEYAGDVHVIKVI